MPKFWAKDYLSEALREQRAIVERMTLAPPAHIEIVDCYAHKGEVEDAHYSMPWIFISPDLDSSLHIYTLLEPLCNDLHRLVAGHCPRGVGNFIGSRQGGAEFGGSGGGNKMMEGVEGYGMDESGSESLFSDDEGEGGRESIGLTQEIDSAVERAMVSMIPGVGSREGGGAGEEFPPENLQGWEKNTTAEIADCYLEEHESPSHLPSLLSALPRVADLVVRLKPKLISDPLLSPTSGQPYSYMHICRSDFEFSEVDPPPREISSLGDDRSSTVTDARAVDHFPHEEIDGISDPVLELHLASPLQPLHHSSPNDILMPVLPQLPSPDKDVEGEMEIDQKELGELVSEAGVEAHRQDQKLQFNSPAAEKPGNTDFIKLNNADVSHDSEDSGIGHAILESPCLPLSLVSSTSPLLSSLVAQLARLEPIPVSPHSPKKLVLLSPTSEDRLLAHFEEESRVFDNVLALMLPYAGLGNHLEGVLKCYNPLHVVEECCDIHPINLTGDSELALPWDPLASSYHAMAAVQRKVVCLQCPLEIEDVASSGNTMETFPKDASTKALDEGLVDTAVQMVEGGDLPSLNTVPTGYLKTRQMIAESKPISDVVTSERKRDSGWEKRGRSEHLLDFEEGMSPLDRFIMLRTGILSPEIAESGTKRNQRNTAKETELTTESKSSQEAQESWVNFPTVQDVYLNREYQVILSKVAYYGTPLMESLQAHGLRFSRESFSSLDPDDVKFFLKQQQKRLADSQGSKEEGVLLQSCKLAACLYILVSFANGAANISLATGIKRFTYLNEKYEELVGNSLDLAKQNLADVQLRSRNQNMDHPKLQTMISIVNTWRTTSRKYTREKVVVVVGKDFSTVSGDILDFLKSISDLKSCVFSFACDSPSNPMYLEALEERFQYYDCLVVPVVSITYAFPWEKVTLLVEYEPLGTGLFPGGQQPANLKLRQWIALKTVQDISVSSLAKSGSSTYSSSVLSFQYTLIASENITNNTKLLQLMESRFNMLLISREYEILKKKVGSGISYADLIVDQATGIIVYPLSFLSSNPGVHTVSTRAAALSLQYERLWILLYAEPESSYPYGGNVPLNLARLYASVAHYCPRQDDYNAKVMCASGHEEVAHLVRSITEETHRQTEGANEQHWRDREWIADDLEMHEKFLLSFPCLNSFTSQLMLRECSLGQILALNIHQLQELFPWLPQKVLKFFSRMCHTSFQQSLPPLPDHGVSEYWENTALNLDDSLQYADDDGNTLLPAEHEKDNQLPHNQTELSFSEGMVLPLSSEDDADLMGVMIHSPSTADQYTNICGTDATLTEDSISRFDPSHLSKYPLLQSTHEKSLGFNDNTPEALLMETSQPQSVANAAVPSDHTLPTSSFTFPLPERSATVRIPSQKQIRSSVLSKLSTSYHDCPTDSIAREYYGNGPSPPRVLTSGMVRRTQGRKPIKSTDSDLSPSQLHLEANDRAVAMYNDSRLEGDRRTTFSDSITGGSTSEHTGWKRMQGMTDLMAFHSRQGIMEGGLVTSKAAISASINPPLGKRIHRAKRPLPCSPVFDYQVPTHTVSPHNGGESSLYSSPNVSFGSFKLSPVRKRRLVYKRLPSSSDGQTKLAFE